MSKPLDILVVADLHFTEQARHACSVPERHAPLARLLFLRAVARMRREGVAPELIVLLGDLVDDGNAEGAEHDLRTLAGEALQLGVPVLAVPGNHDGDCGRFAHIMGCAPGLHVINGYGFLVFHDRRKDGELFERPRDSLALPTRIAAEHPDLPLVALQHNPLHPVIVSGYPYMLANGDDVLESYRAGGVMLSLSGHYHAGQPAHAVTGCIHCTAPALSESPFRFLHVRLEGRTSEVRELALKLPAPGLTDTHCHTEFAYCGTDVDASHAIVLGQALGLSRTCIVEHAFQLYFSNDYAWSFRWQNEPEAVATAWREPSRFRMANCRFHTNAPEPAFFRACLARGTRIALGTDAHELGEVADMTRHLELLAELGAGPERLSDVLYEPL